MYHCFYVSGSSVHPKGNAGKREGVREIDGCTLHKTKQLILVADEKGNPCCAVPEYSCVAGVFLGAVFFVLNGWL